MGRYSVDIEKNAKKQLAELYKSGNKADIKKVEVIFSELEEHPNTGTGNPEQLKYELSGFWSRRINSKDRLIYKINDLEVIVTVISAKGHYGDR
ncbi:Txe/YoeB family addiction module toxin [Arcticibacter tournemirensis]|uniref:Putative mRNA interferase YoeB n=1 Tax=Arcticibacter tournemirensis TaxID=699437 RepID=A0A4Q0M9G1_9SPHI|nr:Txe/YoeB family addiction module toxin [Arcticibacter tournemirensis]RXF69386.1 Txe/YoeB family addiction module toxin [Arcticibacter tournemirensis]